MPDWLLILATAAATTAVLVVWRVLTSREKKVDHLIETKYHVGDEQFPRTIGSLLEPNLVPGNRVTVFNNGDEIFPPMLDAIASARRTITFETFVYWSGSIGRRFADALCERARAGVRVHVILDWLGAKRVDPTILTDLDEAGVQVERYHPIRWHTINRINNRTHRKILVVDGRVGFTGGVGIADEWLGGARHPGEWRDCHFRVEGPAVAQLQRAFMDNWLKTHRTVLHDETYFPALEPAGETLAHVFMSSSSQGSESARLMFLMSIAAAARDIRIGTAYFVPDSLTVRSLVDARERGVRVRVLVPGPNIDKRVVRRASRSRWGELIDAGVEIHEFRPTMYHCKVMIVDGIWVSVGSANFDNRSFRLNDEANLNVYDQALAARLMADFEHDLARSKRITAEEWRRRPLRERVIEHAAGLLRAQM